MQVVKALADFRAYALLAAPKVLDMMRSDSSLAKESLLNVLIGFAHIRGGEHKAPALTGTSTEELLKNLQARQYSALKKDNIVVDYAKVMRAVRATHPIGLGRYMLDAMDATMIAGKSPVRVTTKAVTLDATIMGLKSAPSYFAHLAVSVSKYAVTRASVEDKVDNDEAAIHAAKLWLVSEVKVETQEREVDKAMTGQGAGSGSEAVAIKKLQLKYHIPTPVPTPAPTETPRPVQTAGPTETPTPSPTHKPTNVPTRPPTASPTYSALLSVGKPATQSSTFITGVAAGAEASRAVDGNTNQNYASGSCTHTRNEVRPWWRIDLQRTATVDTVKIWNRVDCCSDRLDGVKVKVGDTLCGGGHTATSATSTLDIDCSNSATPAIGSSVEIYIENDISAPPPLTLCEVQVYGTYQPSAPPELYS